MAKLEVRVASVQIVTRFPAHVIIPDPPGWQPACKMDAGVSLGVTTQAAHTHPVTLGTRSNTPYTECAAAEEKVSSLSGPAIEIEPTCRTIANHENRRQHKSHLQLREYLRNRLDAKHERVHECLHGTPVNKGNARSDNRSAQA